MARIRRFKNLECNSIITFTGCITCRNR